MWWCAVKILHTHSPNGCVEFNESNNVSILSTNSLVSCASGGSWLVDTWVLIPAATEWLKTCVANLTCILDIDDTSMWASVSLGASLICWSLSEWQNFVTKLQLQILSSISMSCFWKLFLTFFVKWRTSKMRWMVCAVSSTVNCGWPSQKPSYLVCALSSTVNCGWPSQKPSCFNAATSVAAWSHTTHRTHTDWLRSVFECRQWQVWLGFGPQQ